MSTDWTDTDQAYERSFSRFCDGTIGPIRALLAGRAQSVLDVGGGLGTLAAALQQDGHRVHLCDAQRSMVARARILHPQLPCVVAALPTLPVPDHSVDVVTANFVINHVAAPRAAVRELARVSADQVVVTIWPSDGSAQTQLWDDLLAQAGVNWPTHLQLDPALDFARTAQGLTGLLDQAGLTQVEVTTESWLLRIDPHELWHGVRAGIARIGTTYRAQDQAGRDRLDRAWAERAAGWPDGLELSLSALLAVGKVGKVAT